MKADSASTTVAHVYPHPRAADAHARALRRARNLHRYQRIETRILDALEHLEDLRQELIARLDLLQGDPDLEPGCDDDVSVASRWVRGRWIDEAELDDADDEPEFGSLEGGHGGTRWNAMMRGFPGFSVGNYAFDGAEPDLAAPEGAQTYDAARCGAQDGREVECEDEGAQCDDEGNDGGDADESEAGCISLMHEGRVVWPPAGTVMREGQP